MHSPLCAHGRRYANVCVNFSPWMLLRLFSPSQMISYEGISTLDYWGEPTPVRGYISQRQLKYAWFE